jgi:putative restriction endonuclease
MRKAFVGITDGDWFEFLSHRPELSECNFWQPGGSVRFKALNRGDLFLFKLHSPNNYIVGGGFFEVSSLLPVSLAWETFGPMNGVGSLAQMRQRIEKYRRQSTSSTDDYTIGNIILQNPFFLRRDAWIPTPADFSRNIVTGKTYNLEISPGRELYEGVEDRLRTHGTTTPSTLVGEGMTVRMFSDPVLARRRLGQGAFRVLVTDAYERRCAVTSEHTLPVLEAAHIRSVSQGGEHQIQNGLLLRSDVHRLFDRGYVTVDPKLRFRVSPRLDAEWKNGKIYYQLDGQRINLPADPGCRPNAEFLEWHSDTVFIK